MSNKKTPGCISMAFITIVLMTIILVTLSQTREPQYKFMVYSSDGFRYRVNTYKIEGNCITVQDIYRGSQIICGSYTIHPVKR